MADLDHCGERSRVRRCAADPPRGVMTVVDDQLKIMSRNKGRGRVSPVTPVTGRGGPRLGVRGEMPVLDGSIVQVQFRGCRPPSSSVLLADPAYILLGRLFTNAHSPGHGLHRHAGGVKLKRTRFLRA